MADVVNARFTGFHCLRSFPELVVFACKLASKLVILADLAMASTMVFVDAHVHVAEN